MQTADRSSPTARALQCLALIQTRPGVTALELGSHLDVTPRAVRRYVQILREADIPIDSVSGPHGGYRVGRGVRMPPVLFSEAEALALTMSAMASVSDQAGDLAVRGLTKLVQALPGKVGEQAAQMMQHAVPDSARHDARPDPSTSSALVAVVAKRRRTRIDYRSVSGLMLERTIDPWAVVARRGLWYLLCWDHGAKSVRTYRVDRVVSVSALEETFDPPADLDPAAALEHHLGSGRAFTARVEFEVPTAQVRPFANPVMGTLKPIADDTACILTGTTDNPYMYASEWLAAIPLPFRVLGGPELVTATAQVAARLTRAASPPPGNAATNHPPSP